MLSLAAQSVTSFTVEYDHHLIGRGSANEVLLKAEVVCGASNVSLQALLLNTGVTTRLADIVSLKVYATGHTDAFDGRDVSAASLLGECTPAQGSFSCPLQGTLLSDTNYLWLVVQVAGDAVEGDCLNIMAEALVADGDTVSDGAAFAENCREVVLARTVLYRPGDYNSAQYRIPGVITAKDGSLVAVTDKRKYNDGDLPQDIDVVCNRSLDGGKTWSEPYTIAQGTGVNQGFGDCALVRGAGEHELIAAFVGGVGLWNSTATNPQRSYVVRSLDDGQTWSEPVDVTDYIFGANCVVPAHRNWRSSFFGSGNGLRTSTGRIIFVAAIRENAQYSLNNYAFYSDDNGVTWQLSGRASVGGDEAKVVELNDGRILMSIRHADRRWYNISSDGGATWQSATSTWQDLVAPACNGDIIRYTSKNFGHDTNRLLHSLPYGTERRDVTVYVSYDEGQTWPAHRCVVPFASAYSSLCVLPDGTIGLYVEEEDTDFAGYQTVFYNFSLDWLTQGDDHFEPSSLPLYNEVPETLKVYPVPASSSVVIDTPDLAQISVFDLSGKMIRSIAVNGESQVRVDVTGFVPGLYLISASDRQGYSHIGKIVVE